MAKKPSHRPRRGTRPRPKRKTDEVVIPDDVAASLGDGQAHVDEALAGGPGPESGGKAWRREPLLFEIAWETCNKLGGIYTVLRSKAPVMTERWGNRYCLIGPYNHQSAAVEFDPATPSGAIAEAVNQLNDQGIKTHFGRWLVTGRPQVVLIEHTSLWHQVGDLKYHLWDRHNIPMPGGDPMVDEVVMFGEACRRFLNIVGHKEGQRRPLVAHFHEWMAGTAIPMLRADGWPGASVFTTHATLLGRYLAAHNNAFYDHLAQFDAAAEAKHFNIEAQHGIECAAAHGAQVFTTVSDVTGEECRHLLGRLPDLLLPNGLNTQRFSALHEFQNLHQKYKEQIHQFTTAHFLPSYPFDLDKTLYFFTSGRYEHRNKGMDLTIESLARLNHRMKQAGSDKTVVFFIITRAPIKSVSVGTLQSTAMMNEFQSTADVITEQINKRLVNEVAKGRVPDLNSLVDETWMLRLRRSIHAWKHDYLPPIVTHDLKDDQKDEVLNQVRSCQLFNRPDDPVKVIFHPDFISSTRPLFGMDYDEFVRGCHMGIFPSYYEPWGYTPLEAIALGVPAVTSDLSGFGSYVLQLLHGHSEKGLHVIRRRTTNYHDSCNELTDIMFRFTGLDRRARIAQRNQVESLSQLFDWRQLGKRYHEAHALAVDRQE